MSIRSEKFIFNVILYYVPLRSSVAYDLYILNFLTWHWVKDLSASRTLALVDSLTEKNNFSSRRSTYRRFYN